MSVGNIDWFGVPLACGAWQASNGNTSLDLVGIGIGGVSQTFDTIPGATY